MMWVRVRVSRVVVRHLAHGVAQPLGQRRLRLLDRQPRRPARARARRRAAALEDGPLSHRRVDHADALRVCTVPDARADAPTLYPRRRRAARAARAQSLPPTTFESSTLYNPNPNPPGALLKRTTSMSGEPRQRKLGSADADGNWRRYWSSNRPSRTHAREHDPSHTGRRL